jgi:hypothetical protein
LNEEFDIEYEAPTHVVQLEDTLTEAEGDELDNVLDTANTEPENEGEIAGTTGETETTDSSGTTLITISDETDDGERESIENLNLQEDNPNQEPTSTQLMFENYHLKATKWYEGMVNHPKIGGVHLGKVPLKMIEINSQDESSYKRNIRDAREGAKIQSGQVYIPIFKRFTLKTGIRNLKNLGAFPAMVTNLMLPDILHKSTAQEKAEVDAIIHQLVHVRNNISSESKISEGNNCIRIEFFFKSKFEMADQRDWKFPKILPWDFAVYNGQNSYFECLTSMMDEVTHALQTTFIDHPNQTNYDSIPVSAKKMLILCSEMAVTMTEFFPFKGRTMEQVLDELEDPTIPEEEEEEREGEGEQEDDEASDNEKKDSDDESDDHNLNDQDYDANAEEISEADNVSTVTNTDTNDPEKTIFHVPRHLLEPLDQTVRDQTGLKNGLKLDTLYLPIWSGRNRIKKLSSQDISERQNDYIQIFLNQSTKGTTLMNHYVYVMGKILSLMWYHQEKFDDLPRETHSILDLPNFSILARIPKEDKQKMLGNITKLVANTYDFEWWWIVKTRTRRFVTATNDNLLEPIGGPEDFPTTINELHTFLADKGTEIRINRTSMKTLTDTGTYDFQ